MQLDIAIHTRDQLGEGPCWLDDTGELVRVDITAGLVHAWSSVTGTERTLRFGRDTSAAVPRAGGGFVVAVDRELLLVDPDGGRRRAAAVEPDRPDNRFNDCRADRAGRLWAGTMSRSRTPGSAALYRLRPGAPIEAAIGPTTLSNGLGWSPGNDRLYFIDSVTQRIDVCSFDASEGIASERRAFVRIDPDDGLPDGLTVDAEGGVWVCLFGGGAIRRYDEQGGMTEAASLPVSNPTCPCFGGDDLRTLFVTTARHKLSDAQLAAQPLAGAVFAGTPGVQGQPTNPFRG